MLYFWKIGTTEANSNFTVVQLIFRWVDEANYIELTRPWYATVLPFPYNYYYPGRYERDAKKYIETMFVDDEDMSVIETHVGFV